MLLTEQDVKQRIQRSLPFRIFDCCFPSASNFILGFLPLLLRLNTSLCVVTYAWQNFAKSLLDVVDNLGRASSVVKGRKDSSGAIPFLKTLPEVAGMTEKQLMEVKLSILHRRCVIGMSYSTFHEENHNFSLFWCFKHFFRYLSKSRVEKFEPTKWTIWSA